MPGRRLPPRDRGSLERPLTLLYQFFTDLLGWRPSTLLDCLLLVAVAGILIALALVVAVTFHLFHRLT